MHLSGEWAGKLLGGEFGPEGLLGMVISYGLADCVVRQYNHHINSGLYWLATPKLLVYIRAA